MASTAVHIANMLEAIHSGVIPGKFAEDRTEFKFRTLAYVGARGATHYWTIRVRLLKEGSDAYAPIADSMLDQPAADLQGYKAEISVESMQAEGKVRDIVPTYVSEGKNLGKKNATNALTQALRNALGLYNKQKKRADIVEADNDDGEGEGEEGDIESPEFDSMPPPMLVKKIGDTREASLTPEVFARGVTLQRKFNGVRYIVFERTGPGGAKRLIRYSRTGSEYPGQKHVVTELSEMYKHVPRIAPGEYGVPALVDGKPTSAQDERVLRAYGAYPAADSAEGNPAPYLDGELYLVGKNLNWISGQARRGDDKGILNYHVFDIFFPYAKAAGHDMESRHRQEYLKAFFAATGAAGLRHPHILSVENFPVGSMEDVTRLAKGFVLEGYEGAIARKDTAGYYYSYSNYHAAHLMKIKPVHDAEFTVVGYSQGTRGKDVGAVIWECEVPSPVNPRDKWFTAVPKDMTYEDRYALFSCLGKEIEGDDGKKVTLFEKHLKGLPLTVEYAEISAKTGKPLQPKAVAFRTYEAGPGKDPVRRLLEECRLEAAARK
jgi:hypothetical protein